MDFINIVSVVQGANYFSITCVCFIFREIQEPELQKFQGRLVKLLQGKELGHETVDSLQRLHLILSATKYTRT